MSFSRSKQIIEKIAEGVNKSDLILEANAKDVFEKAKDDLKQKLIKKYVGKVPNVTKRHINFMVEMFGLKYAEKLDPKAISNLLKNPERMFNKMRDTMGKETFAKYAKQVEQQVPGSVDAMKTLLKSEKKLKAQVTKLTDRLNALEQQITDEKRLALVQQFQDFIKNRREYRKRFFDNDLKGYDVIYYDGKDLRIGKVIHDYNFMDDDAFAKLLGLGENDKNDMVKISELRGEFRNTVTIKPSDGRKSEVVTSKWHILPAKYAPIIKDNSDLSTLVAEMVEDDSDGKVQHYFDGSMETKEVIKTFNKLGKLELDLRKVEHNLSQYGFNISDADNFISISKDGVTIKSKQNSDARSVLKKLKNLDQIDYQSNDPDTIFMDNVKYTDNGFINGNVEIIPTADKTSIKMIRVDLNNVQQKNRISAEFNQFNPKITNNMLIFNFTTKDNSNNLQFMSYK